MTSSDHPRHADCMRYLAAVAVARSMYQQELIGKAGYAALEKAFNSRYTPLFRYPTPSNRDDIRITLDTRIADASYAGQNEGGSI